MTLFRLLLDATGLSQREAAAFSNVDERTVRRWAVGKFDPPEGVINDLFALLDRQKTAAREALAQIETLVRRQRGVLPEEIEIGVSADDHEARSLGWPTASAHAAVIRLLVETAPPEIRARLVIVPRGSTTASAAASDAHGL